jgi:hypothetical protein
MNHDPDTCNRNTDARPKTFWRHLLHRDVLRILERLLTAVLLAHQDRVDCVLSFVELSDRHRKLDSLSVSIKQQVGGIAVAPDDGRGTVVGMLRNQDRDVHVTRSRADVRRNTNLNRLRRARLPEREGPENGRRQKRSLPAHCLSLDRPFIRNPPTRGSGGSVPFLATVPLETRSLRTDRVVSPSPPTVAIAGTPTGDRLSGAVWTAGLVDARSSSRKLCTP